AADLQPPLPLHALPPSHLTFASSFASPASAMKGTAVVKRPATAAAITLPLIVIVGVPPRGCFLSQVSFGGTTSDDPRASPLYAIGVCPTIESALIRHEEGVRVAQRDALRAPAGAGRVVLAARLADHGFLAAGVAGGADPVAHRGQHARGHHVAIFDFPDTRD